MSVTLVLFTQEELLKIMPRAAARMDEYYEPLLAAMNEFEINLPLRVCAFLAQVAEESGELRWLKELWGPTEQQKKYEGRADLGNTEPGDGFKFRGRGILQITGRANYRVCSAALYADDRLLVHPELLESPEGACRSAGWFWRDYKGLNDLADRQQFERITRRINGGLTHHEQRVAYYELAKKVLIP